MIREFGGKKPQVHEGVFVAESAELIGDVMVGKGSSIWFGAVLRGDEAPITIGENSSVQDNSVLHGFPALPTIVKDGVTLGHRVIAHSATISDNCIIGMGAILLNGSEIGENSIVGAGAVVTEGTKIPPNSLVVGIPGKVVRELGPGDIKRIRENALAYVELARKHIQEGR